MPLSRIVKDKKLLAEIVKEVLLFAHTEYTNTITLTLCATAFQGEPESGSCADSAIADKLSQSVLCTTCFLFLSRVGNTPRQCWPLALC